MSAVSVQIVTYNSEQDIVPCLKAVFSQSYPIEKIIIIDNQSKDRTLELIRDFRCVKIIKNSHNNGFAGGHNQGFSCSKSDYVLVLNPDVILDKDYVRNIIRVIEGFPSVGMATGKLYRDKSKKLIDSTGIIIKKNRRAFDRGAGEKDIGQYDDNLDLFGVSGAAAVYKRSMIKDISICGQFYDETFFAYKEDVDVSWRARLLGWNALFVPNAVAEHSRGWKEEKKRLGIFLFIRQHSYINRYFCILKNDRLPYFLIHIPIILFYEILSFSYALLKERELLKVWAVFLKEFKQMFKKRRIIQKKRKTSSKKIYSYFKGIW
ncbi:MAG: glycosyltransferase family 2 protein [Bacillota bacterium]|nr:glycosyltransferase family 2 protein [Bacillota bacterium]